MKKNIIRVISLMVVSLTLTLVVSAAEINSSEKTADIISTEINEEIVPMNTAATDFCYYCATNVSGTYYCSGLIGEVDNIKPCVLTAHPTGCEVNRTMNVTAFQCDYCKHTMYYHGVFDSATYCVHKYIGHIESYVHTLQPSCYDDNYCRLRNNW